jgi:hypothetical protein
LKESLLLADRGYPGVDYLEAVRDAGGFFIVRITRSVAVDGEREGFLGIDREPRPRGEPTAPCGSPEGSPIYFRAS